MLCYATLKDLKLKKLNRIIASATSCTTPSSRCRPSLWRPRGVRRGRGHRGRRRQEEEAARAERRPRPRQEGNEVPQQSLQRILVYEVQSIPVEVTPKCIRSVTIGKDGLNNLLL